MIRFPAATFAVGASMMIACLTPTRAQMADRFQERLTSVRGSTLKEERVPYAGFIGERLPSEVHELGNGRILHVYREYWLQYGVNSSPCDVFVEIDGRGIVVAAVSKGDGCVMVY